MTFPNLVNQLQSPRCGVGMVRETLSLSISTFSNKRLLKCLI